MIYNQIHWQKKGYEGRKQSLVIFLNPVVIAIVSFTEKTGEIGDKGSLLSG